MTELESAMRRAHAGELPIADLLRTLAASTVLVPSEQPTVIAPVVVHRDALTFAVAFTREGITFPPTAGRALLPLSGSVLLRGLVPGVGLVVDPGAELGFEVSAQVVAEFAEALRAERQVRYFVRFRNEGARVIPFAMLRRRIEDGTPVDEVLRDVDLWAPDRNGSVDRALRRPLDSDLVEVDEAKAAQFLQMVAARSYRPFD